MIFATPAISRTGEGFYNALLQAAPSASVEVTPISVARVDADTSQAIEEFAAKPNSGLISAADPGGTGTRAITIRLAARHRLPAVYPFRYFATDGGLAVYGVDLNDQYRRAAGYVDRILRGTKAADLPIQAPDKFELIFNLKAARAAGITIPPSLLVRADEVIE